MAPPHVVAFSLPAQGHINPMILLCRKLASKGFVVTFVNTRSRHEQHFKQTGPAGDDSFRFVSIPDECLPKKKLGSLQLFLNATEGMRKDLEDLVLELSNESHRPPVTCMLFDGFLEWSQDFCNKLQLGFSVLWTPSAACLVLQFHLPLIRHILPAKGRNDLIDFVPGLFPLHASQLPSTLQNEDEYDPGFERRIRRVDVLKGDVWVFVNSFEELEPSPLAAAREANPKCISVGPLHYSVGEMQLTSEWTEDRSCLDWLDKQAPRSVVYVSFGSAANISIREAQQIYKGLDESDHAFLWVIRLNLLQGTDEEIKELTTKIQENQKALTVSWAPQVKVLEHESIGAFFSHCGWNSTIESLSFGIPMLCMPCFAEQAMNCAWIVDKLKAGVRAKKDLEEEVHASHICEMVQLLLGEGDSEMRCRLEVLKDAAKRKYPGEWFFVFQPRQLF